MVQALSILTRFGYIHVFKPLLFRATPDTVHARLLQMSATRQRLSWSDAIVRSVWAFQDTERLRQSIGGVTFNNPVGLSAGFDKNIEMAPTMKAVGFGFMTGGSVTFRQCDGNARPWFYRLPRQKSLVVHVGLANEGAGQVRQRLHTYTLSTFDEFPLVVSVAKTNSPQNCNDQEAIADYAGSLTILRDTPNISVFEINISCPNTYGGEPFTTPQRLEPLLMAIDALDIHKPIWVKMPLNLAWLDFKKLLEVIAKHNVQAVTIGNLSKDRSGIPSTELPAEVAGNLSGLPTQALSDDLIRRTYEEYGKRLTIIGVGGIFSAEDAYRKICNGASLVALITGMIFEGPQLIGQINHDLVKLLKEDGFKNISEAVGSKVTSNT